jgi:hypothetical protein
MSWTKQKQDLLERYERAFGLPSIDNSAARAWTMKLAEQFNATFPMEGWGTKRGDAGRPPSTDCICTRDPFVGYDVILNQGVPGGQRLADYPEAIDLRGQVFIPVSAINHLGSIPEPEPLPPVHVCPPPPPKPNYPGDRFFIEKIGQVLEADYAEAGQRLNAGSSVWFSRTIWRHVNEGMSMDESTARSRKEWRAALGLQ